MRPVFCFCRATNSWVVFSSPSSVGGRNVINSRLTQSIMRPLFDVIRKHPPHPLRPILGCRTAAGSCTGRKSRLWNRLQHRLRLGREPYSVAPVFVNAQDLVATISRPYPVLRKDNGICVFRVVLQVVGMGGHTQVFPGNLPRCDIWLESRIADERSVAHGRSV